ncbi:MAG: Phosphatidate cytidylyltransferase [bacterium ADurb.Bin236]|nr:MAG: Phosphatidate cytidylyltransferase [bacterium ADurb.Bin236]
MSINKDFTSRLIIGVSLSLIGLFLCWYSWTTFFLVWSFFAVFAMKEYLKMVRDAGSRANFPAAFLMLLALMGTAVAAGRNHQIFNTIFAGFMLITAGLYSVYSKTGREKYNALFITGFGAMYIGGAMGCLISLRDFSDANIPGGFSGFSMFFMVPLVGAWASDTGAYLTGRFIGKDRFSQVSPNKTVEGVIGALFAGFTATVAFGEFAGFPRHLMLFLAVLIPAVSLCGDLFESAIKRRCMVKDSGAMLGAHGGVLDRFDSVFFSIPVTYFAVYFLHVYSYI